MGRDLESSDPRVRLEAVEASENELELVPVAIGDEWPRVRMAAVARVRNDLLLARIVREASELDVDMIIAGSHGRGAVYHLLVGSVSEGLLRKSRCPVLVVPTRNNDV